MSSLIIRNDDVSADTDIDNLKVFCYGCDRYGVQIIHAITPLGETHAIEKSMTDGEIVALGGKKTLLDNVEVVRFLRSRTQDFFAVHGLWHSHKPPYRDVATAKEILNMWGLNPKYFFLPFNEGEEYADSFCDLKVLGHMERIEDYLPGMPKHGLDIPKDIKMLYLHEWRFEEKNKFGYRWEDLWQIIGKRTSIRI